VIIFAVVVLGLVIAAALWVFLKGARLRTSIYRYRVNGDQHFDFPPSRSTHVVCRLTNGHIDIPPATQTSAVVLLELQIRRTLPGFWFEPYITIDTVDRRLRQPFERGGAGVRYIDLTDLVRKGGRSLRLAGHFLDIRDQSVVLHCLLHDVDLDRSKILVIGTHPDDAEIAAFGVYADRDAYVVTLTAGEAGEPGPFARFGARAHLEKGRNRSWNSVAVPMLGGLSIDRTANLGYFDGTLETMRARPDTPVRSLYCQAEFLDAFGYAHDAKLIESRQGRHATWKNLVADLEHLVKVIQPDVIVTPSPRLDAHPDHKMSTVALLEALRNLDRRQGSLLLYTNHLCTSDRFPFGDAGDLVSLPPGVEGIFFEGIVSNPLDAEMQNRKHMALDAMIDLRTNIQADSLRSVATAFKNGLKTTITDGYMSYFRQAVRANELFFEVSVSSLYEPGVTEKILG
jgi:LmbE family N-acetylglucosaminyl deacetylase